MTGPERSCLARAGLALMMLLPASCSRAPSFDIIGSFFPAWLDCFVLAIALTVLARWLMLRSHIELSLPVLAYPSLTAFFTFSLWLVFFS